MRIRLLLVSTISVLFAGVTAAPAGAQCLAADVFIIQNGHRTYLIPHRTCVVNTPFPAGHFGDVVSNGALPPGFQGVGFDVWIPGV